MATKPTAKPVPTCRQILTSGHFCKCPALRTGVFCYYHNRARQRRRIFEQAREVQLGYNKHRDSRTEDEFNSEVVQALDLPALDDKASIHVACSNLVWALYCDHISVAKARVMMRAIAEANLSLRRGRVLDEYQQPVLETDPEPITPMGDEDGCIFPEQRDLKAAIVEGRRTAAARADAEIAAARARGENPPPRPLTPEEQKAAALEQRRAQGDREELELWRDALSASEPGSPQHQLAQSRLAEVEDRIRLRTTKQKAQACQPVPNKEVLAS